jgi:hypothetical protein
MEKQAMKDVSLNTAASLYGVSAAGLHALRGGHFAQVYGFKRNGKKFRPSSGPTQ